LIFRPAPSFVVGVVRGTWLRDGEHDLPATGGTTTSVTREPKSKIPKKISPRHFFTFPCWGSRWLIWRWQTSLLAWCPGARRRIGFHRQLFVERLYGQAAARFVTGMILWIAVASAFFRFARCIGVPVSAARTGIFFPVFGRVHPTNTFRHISLLCWLGLHSYSVFRSVEAGHRRHFGDAPASSVIGAGGWRDAPSAATRPRRDCRQDVADIRCLRC